MSRTIYIDVEAEGAKIGASAPKSADIEGRAAGLVARLTPGARTEPRDFGGGKQIRDFDVICGDGHPEPLEVTCATLDFMEQARAAHAKYLPQYVIRAVRGLGFEWSLIPSERVRFKMLTRDSIAPALRELEQADIRQWFKTRDARRFPLLAQMGFHAALRHSSVSSRGLSEIVVGAPTDASVWTSDSLDPGANVMAAIEAAAFQEDNRAKLRHAGLGDRHLFVWITDTNNLPWRNLYIDAIPLRPPALPEEVTIVWAASTMPAGRARVWRWRVDSQWTSVLVAPS